MSIVSKSIKFLQWSDYIFGQQRFLVKRFFCQRRTFLLIEILVKKISHNFFFLIGELQVLHQHIWGVGGLSKTADITDTSKGQIELFILFPDLRLKIFFYLMFLNFAIEFKPEFKNRNWNYLNRKWTYFSYFLTSYQKSSFIKYFQLLPTSLKLVLKKEMELSILFTDLRSKILLHNVFWVKKFLGKKFLA